MHKQSDTSIILAHSLSILLWASAFVGIRAGLDAYTPEHLSLLRLLVGSTLLAIFGFIFRIRLPEAKDIPAILLLGGLGFTVYHTTLNYGEQTVSAGVASVFVSTTPIFAAIFALLFFGEQLGIRQWAGAMLAFLGVIIISLGTGSTFQFNNGVLLILLAAFSESIYFTFQKPYLEKYGFFAFTSYAIWAGTFWMLIFLPGLGDAIMHAPRNVTVSILYLGVFPTVVPYLALAFIASRNGASEATRSLYLIPSLAFIIAWIWLGEIPAFLSIVGGAITLFGVLLSNIKTDKKQDQPNYGL
ncbi:DMT family transporter [Aneurinibacillus aneurinilyticus]|uniref:DMT family transporter n=1 Tax=Aneurinibacillus aneurinilyticus TaxID=1391 RepID=UPI0023F26BBC|nr:DMT family transporter [Aneurinibacillus aneurinilyticus]